MRGFLLDTNVLSELRRPICNQQVLQFVETQPEGRLFTSEVNFAEIRFGIDELSEEGKRTLLQEWLDRTLRPWFVDTLATVNEDVLCAWRHIVETGRKRGYTFPEPDTLIAATALHHRLIIVSRDVKPFVEAGCPVLNPWNASFVGVSGAQFRSVTLDNPKLLDKLSNL